MPDKTVLGIDLRVSAVKAVELKKTAHGWDVLGWGMTEIPSEIIQKHPDKEIEQANILKKLITDNNIKSKDAFVVVGGPDVLVKHISVPALSHEETKQAIKWKIKDELGYSPEEAVIDFKPLGKPAASGESDFLVVSIKAETLNRIIQVMNLSNLRLISVIPLPLAIKEIYKEHITQDKYISLIYMGKRTTNISFYKDEKLYFNREIPIGGEDITKAMTSVLVSAEGRLELSYDEAEKLKKEQGIPLEMETPSHLNSLIRPTMEKLENEIARSIEYLKMNDPEAVLEKIVVTGGASKTPNILEFLSKSLGLPCVEENPLQNVGIDPSIKDADALKAAGYRLTAAIGAAMLSESHDIINLSPAEIRDKWKLIFQKHSNPIELSSVLVGVLLLFYLVLLYIGSGLQTSINDTQKKLAVIRPKLARLDALEKAMKEEEGRRGIFKSIELSRIKIPSVLKSISQNLPTSAIIDNIEFIEKSKTVGLKGVVFSRGGKAENIISKFIYNLSNAPIFDKVDLIQATKTSGYLYEAYNFEIIGLVKKL